MKKYLASFLILGASVSASEIDCSSDALFGYMKESASTLLSKKNAKATSNFLNEIVDECLKLRDELPECYLRANDRATVYLGRKPIWISSVNQHTNPETGAYSAIVENLKSENCWVAEKQCGLEASKTRIGTNYRIYLDAYAVVNYTGLTNKTAMEEAEEKVREHLDELYDLGVCTDFTTK